jgi:hypothetical protein
VRSRRAKWKDDDVALSVSGAQSSWYQLTVRRLGSFGGVTRVAMRANSSLDMPEQL